ATHGRVQHEAAVAQGSGRRRVGEGAALAEAPGPTCRAAGSCAAGPALGQVPKEAGVADRCRGPEVHIDSATLGGTARAAGWIGAAPRAAVAAESRVQEEGAIGHLDGALGVNVETTTGREPAECPESASTALSLILCEGAVFNAHGRLAADEHATAF